MDSFLPLEQISSKIYFIRGQKIMLDRDLAKLYGVETRRLNEQVRRNLSRFPKDFMFQLTHNEKDNLISQFATSSWGGARKLPLAFTEHGILMLSSVLSSEKAVQVNIQITRTFVKLRQFLATHEEIKTLLEDHDSKINSLIEAVNHLLQPLVEESQKRIGFYKDPSNSKPAFISLALLGLLLLLGSMFMFRLEMLNIARKENALLRVQIQNEVARFNAKASY